MNFKRVELKWMVVLVVVTSWMLGDRANAASVEELVGEWTVSVDFSGASQLARLEIAPSQGEIQATLSSEFGSAKIEDISVQSETCLMNYRVDSGNGSRGVQLALQMADDSLVGSVTTGEGEAMMQWPIKAARIGTDAEATLKAEHAAAQDRGAGHVATLPADQAMEFLGAWELTLKNSNAEDARSVVKGLLIMDVGGKIVVSLKNPSGPQRTFYEVSTFNNGLRWSYDVRFGDTNIPFHMDIVKHDDELSVKLTSQAGGDGSPALFGTGIKKDSGQVVGIDPDLVAQPPQVELVGSINAPARVIQASNQEVFVQEGREVTVLQVANPLLLRFKLFRVLDRSRVVSIADSKAYIVAGNSLQVFDISEPPDVRMVGSCGIPGNSPGTVGAAGSRVFATNWNGKANTQQLHFVDASDAMSPTLLSSHDTPMGASNYDIAISDTQVVLANAFGLRIIDISTPHAPQLLSNFKGRGRWVRGVDLSGSMAYVATSMATGASWLEMVDISDPSAPIQSGIFPTLGVAQDVAIAGSMAYVADREGGLVVVDVSDPTNPRRRGFYRTRGNANRVAVCGGLVLLEIAGMRSNSLLLLRYAP